MNGKEELHSQVEEKTKRIHELINKFILTPEISELMEEVARLRTECSITYGHEFENGVCKCCGAKQKE